MNTGNNGPSSSHLIPLELSDELKQEAIVTRFDKDTRTGALLLSLNHKYNKKNIVFPVPPIKKIDWTTFLNKFSKLMIACGISLEHILMIEDVITTNYEIVIGLTENPEQQENSASKQKVAYHVRKYTAKGTLPLHEAVVFADSGQAVFVYLDRDDDGKLKTVNYIERSDKIIIR